MSEKVVPMFGDKRDLPGGQADNVVAFSDGPKLDDIPALLRNLANNIEQARTGDDPGDYVDVETVLVLIPVKGDWPRVFGFGKVDSSTTDPALVCEMAKTWLINNLVERR